MVNWYLDASAAVKLLTDEPESPAFREVVSEAKRLLSSVVLLAEVGAFAERVGADPVQAIDRIEPICDLVTVTADVARFAARLAPPTSSGPRTVVRALDAIHVATALLYVDVIEGLLTYDDRQATAARAVGVAVHSPGRKRAH